MPLKSDVLSVLLKNRNKDISGQDLAELFGVSRNAVWKAINSLKEQGYEIISSTNKGYRLSPDSDVLSDEEISAYLEDKNIKIYTYDSLDSTNNEAKRLLVSSENENSVMLIASENQTNGRGRFGRNFYSQKGMGVYFSLVLSPHSDFESISKVTTYAAVCVADAVLELSGTQVQIKWVNDIYSDGKKICGILTEAVSDFESGSISNIIIGIGLNIKETPLPPELKDTVGFLNFDGAIKNQLIGSIVNKLLLFEQNKGSYIDRYRKYSMVIGKEIKFTKSNREFFGTALDIDEQGGLKVECGGKTEILKSGEISLKLL